ncbi:MAG TPA: hypothetical protein D7I01_07495 [Candidatus Poseidoniales archaeon]|nr:MAG TPA: hypothetical protein D7I01_07495 [Candidatus Poseidoniales archaeon]
MTHRPGRDIRRRPRRSTRWRPLGRHLRHRLRSNSRLDPNTRRRPNPCILYGLRSTYRQRQGKHRAPQRPRLLNRGLRPMLPA